MTELEHLRTEIGHPKTEIVKVGKKKKDLHWIQP